MIVKKVNRIAKEIPEVLKKDMEKYETKKKKNVAPLFITSDNGTIKKLLTNLKIMLSLDPLTKKIGYNEFTKTITLNEEPIDDSYLNQLRLSVDRTFQMTFSKDDIITTLENLAKEKNSYHPVKRMVEKKSGITQSVWKPYL